MAKLTFGQQPGKGLQDTLNRAFAYEIIHGFVNLISTGPSLEVMRVYYRMESTRRNPLRFLMKTYIRVVGMYIYVLAYLLYKARKEPDKWEGFIGTLPSIFLFLGLTHALIVTREWRGVRHLAGGCLFSAIEFDLARRFYRDLRLNS